MIAILYYLIKVVLCSGLLFAYYWLVLRNKQFHQYNRFYLLGISILSWLVPFIKIGIVKEQVNTQLHIMNFANVVADNNSSFEQVVVEKSAQFTWDSLLIIISIAITIFFVIRFVMSIWKIRNLLKKYPLKELMGLYLVMTNVKGAPFSFFKYIFWNSSIDLKSDVGQKILAHEVVHVDENHSLDKLIIELQLIIGWFNPITWFIRNELYLIHEFIADQKSIENRDAAVLAELLLTSAYPQQQHLLSNPFFFSPIKRRIQMLTKSTNTKYSYLRRLSILPIMSILVMLFAFRNDTVSKPILKLDKQYTVIIDAGHGGTDPGASAADGATEKEMTLLIAQKIKSLNNNPNIKIVLTRESDKFTSVMDRSNLSNKEKGDLFISIHMGGDDNINESGSVYLVPYRKNIHVRESELLANNLLLNTKKVFEKGEVTTKQNGVWVIENVNMPAVLWECGYITNRHDEQLVKQSLDKLAIQLLAGIDSYLSIKMNPIIVNDSSRVGMNNTAIKKSTTSKVNSKQISTDLTEAKKDLVEASEALKALDSIDFASKISELITNLDLNKIAKNAMVTAKVNKKVQDSILKLNLNQKVKEAIRKSMLNDNIKKSIQQAIKVSEDVIQQQVDSVNKNKHALLLKS